VVGLYKSGVKVSFCSSHWLQWKVRFPGVSVLQQGHKMAFAVFNNVLFHVVIWIGKLLQFSHIQLMYCCFCTDCWPTY